MAFFSKSVNILKQTVSKHVNSDISGSNPSMFQILRWMSSSKLFVGGISYSTDDTSLREAFNKYGEVVEARVIMDRETGRSRGFAFITYTSGEEASAAIQALDGQELHGRRIRVNYANDRPRTGGFGGGGYGAGGYGGGGGGGMVVVLVIMEGVDTVVATMEVEGVDTVVAATMEVEGVEAVTGEATFLRVAVMEVDMAVVSVGVLEAVITMLVVVFPERVMTVVLRVSVLLEGLVVVITLLVIVGQIVALLVVDLEEVT
ncbi:hypothetical protein NMG60_11023899 [Bertholletia excelsa]